MTDYSFDRQEMTDPIERMFEREFPSEYGMFENIEEEETEGGGGKVDIVYIAGAKENLHVIRLYESFDSCVFSHDRGILSMRDIQANYIWLALPLDEFRDGEDEHNDIIQVTCEKRGLGVITLQPKGRGISAKILIQAQQQAGNFMDKYGDLGDRWRKQATDALVKEDLKVINYYTS